MTSQPDARYYAVTRLEEAARDTQQACADMPILRKRAEKSKEAFTHLQNQKTFLVNALTRCKLAMLESELPTDYLDKLTASVRKFPLITSDYGKFTTVLQGFAAQLSSQTTSAAVIGRLMISSRNKVSSVKYLR
ncbi:hypothetical protein FACS1894208_01660 [Clostridia bacterium]|nr:hypothetical protein FACS1894208_01660 [Clostridia bacterium]